MSSLKLSLKKSMSLKEPNKASVRSRTRSDLEGDRSFLTADKIFAESAYLVR